MMKTKKNSSVPIWRNKKVIPIVFQVLFVILIGSITSILFHNMQVGLARMNFEFGFEWLNFRAGFNINESLIEYSPSDSYMRAFLVGVMSTLRVSFFGIILATIVGVLVGIAKMSDNWLLSKVASVYIEIFRNTPLLLQIFILNYAIFLSLPHINEGIGFGPVFLSNRGTVIPWFHANEQSTLWIILLVSYLVLSFFVIRKIMRIEIEKGKEYHPFLIGLVTFLALFFLTYTILREGPATLTIPEHTGQTVVGGLSLSTPFSSVLFALTIFTSTYIAEIVRGGIEAVPKGQKEATQALGFKPATAMRLVIFPQAIRIIIPPMTSQYLNLIKNSSLAMAVGFQEIVGVGNTVMNQSGRAIETVLIMIGCYLVFSLLTSLFMNFFNKKFQLVER